MSIKLKKQKLKMKTQWDGAWMLILHMRFNLALSSVMCSLLVTRK